MKGSPAIERAFELAKSGQYRSVSEILRRLPAEDRPAVEAHLLRAQRETRADPRLQRSLARNPVAISLRLPFVRSSIGTERLTISSSLTPSLRGSHLRNGEIIDAAARCLRSCCTGASAAAEPYHLIPGAVPLDSGPDGNTIVLDAPQGLIVFDTGRHPEHAQAILDYAKARRRPIAAVVNSHWHLDHTTGNWDIRRAYPRVQIYASNALEGALATFLKKSRADTGKMLADPENAARGARPARARDCGDRPPRANPPQPHRLQVRPNDHRRSTARRPPRALRGD